MSFDDDDEGLIQPSPPANPATAKELVLALRDALVAGTTAPMNYRPDKARYLRERKKLGSVLRQLGIRNPFPWPTIDEALAAAKTEHSGTGSHALRTRFFKTRATEALSALDARIADSDSGDIAAAIGELRLIAGNTVKDASALRHELARIEAALPIDPGAAISRAKNLMEAVAKRVIIDSGETVVTDRNFASLAVQASEVLGVDRKSVMGYDKDIGLLMEKLHGYVNAIGDLRNAVGDGHGAAELPVNLDLRHGRLAVRSAIAWCGFMLETLHDRLETKGVHTSAASEQQMDGRL